MPREGIAVIVKRVILVIVVAVALLGVQASSAASVGETEDGIGVHTDRGALVIDAGEVSGVSTDDGGLLLDTGTGSAAGVAPSARYTYGDLEDPTATPAFTLSNTDDRAHRLTVSYSGADSEDPDANVQFRLYDRTGTRLATASEESGAVTVDLDGHERVYVVVVIDTHGLSPESDLSGSLTATLA